MALCSDESMATLLSSLLKSFHAVPATALPAMLDCVLSSSGVSSSMLFDLLLSSFSNLDEEFGNEPGKLLGAEQCRILVAYSRSLSHLLKNLGVNSVSLQSFIWKAFVPLMKKGHSFDRETLNEIQDSFLEIVSTNSSWTIVEATLVPLFIRSVRSSMDLHQNKETSTNKRSNRSAVQDSEHKLFAPCDGKEILDLASSLPLRISCYVLSSLLGAALERYRAQGSLLDGPLPLEGSSSEKKILSNLLWELCDISIHMLLQSYEHRSCAVGLLFPTILDAFAFKHSFEVFVDEKTINISRNSYFMRIWECCSLLFSQGPMERRDAYGIISLYLSYLPCVESCEVEVLDRAEEFDITAEIQFWAEIKRGLVSKENLVRKQALQTLRKALMIHEGKKSSSSSPEKKSLHKSSVPFGMTKRDVYAEEEAMSLGVGKIFKSVDHCSVEWMKWEAFILLYEMLEEYGTHLVEAAWNHQIALLLDSSCLEDRTLNAAVGGFCWLAILWERGLFHDNPLVRCLIMESFLHIQWERQGNIAGLFPDDFLLGPFMEGLNDPVHHKDFGLKGIYTSRTIVGAAGFLHHYCIFLGERRCISFLSNLASVAKHLSLGRAGLMALAECISSASNSAGICMIESNHVGIYEARYETDTAPDCNEPGCLDNESSNQKTDLVDGLRFLIESSKQHFNACYRLKVCEKLLRAATMVVCAHELPLDMLFLFIAAVPRDFTDSDVPLRSQLQEWLAGCSKQVCEAKCSDDKMKLLRELLDFPDRFMHQSEHGDSLRDYDDEDMIAWGTMSGRWSRVLFLLMEEPPMQALFTFLKENGTKINQHSYVRCIPVKFLIIILSLVDELEVMLSKAGQGLTMLDKSEDGLQEKVDSVMLVKDSLVVEKFAESFLFILEELTSFSASSCSIFWSDIEEDKADLPGAVIGKLGGPSQRRLSSSMTTSVLRAITSIRTVAFLSSWCSRVKENVDLMTPCTFLWEFFWKVVSKPVCEKETTAEINLAAYEAVSSMLKALVPMFSAPMIKFILKTNASSPPLDEAKPLLDCLVLSFLEPCNELLRCGKLARTRLAVLLNWKWLCLESLLSLPCHALQNGVNQGCNNCFFSGGVVEHIFDNLVESLENAAEDSVLPMLRSIRLIFDMLTADEPYISSCNVVDMQMMWKLVQSSWILHVSCKKRRVAPIAALLSSVLHSSFFGDESMHVADNTIGPLKWFCAKILEEGTKSPRTTRLAALHLTGLWLRNPRIIGLYINELKLLTLYGSVAFDEDFESEINERGDARTEVSLLAKSPDPEITEMFINTELYARVSVAVLFQKLGGLVEMAGSEPKDETCYAALEAGQSFLLALLDSVINDKDLAKELYKKYSAIHRRKVRAWQMICILSPFVNNVLTQQVLHILHMAILRNNMPSVRQYMETFAINIYLKFPQMVREHLVPILADHNMKTQALSSYVYIAANVILHASGTVQSQHLENLLPPIVPLLTSHHHTLRGFTQLLVFKVFSRLLPGSDCTGYETFPLEKKCFVDLKLYLAQNPDCVRLRSSMEGFLDAFNPKHAVTPAGIFSNRTETLEFECVPASLMEQVVNFLNDAREELRDAMAKDEVTIKNESLKSASSPNSMDLPVTATREDLAGDLPYDLPLDFQKKFTLLKHEREDNSSRCLLDHLEIYKPLADLEKEDKLLMQMLQSRYASMEKIRATRQEIVVVASLIDRIPNLAGLARTCEVFKATGLAVADAKVTQDRQFQLISVTAEKWVPIFEVPVNSMKTYLEKKKREGFCLLGLEQTTNSVSLDKYEFPKRTVLVLGREKEGIPVDIIHILDACVEIPQLGVVRSLNVHVSGGIALWEYTRQQRSK